MQLEGLTVRGGMAQAAGPEPAPSSSNGGGILNLGDVRITNGRLTGNMSGGADAGGGLANRGGAVTIAQSVVADNRADAGGGLVSFDGMVQITESSFMDNSASHPGGAVWNCRGTVTIATSTFVRNGGDPAAIANGSECFAGTMTIVSTTISDSNSNTDGGISNSGTMLVLNNAIVRNRAEAFETGGIGNSGTLTLINTTAADNRPFNPEQVGGLRNGPSGTAVLVNTILARNTAEKGVADSAGTVTSQGHNLIGDPTGCTVTLQASDLTGPSGLGRLVDDGTPGHAHLPLLPASRAIDAGDNDVCSDPRLATDQLGHPRVGICDIGAIEFQEVRLDIRQGRAERLGTTNAKVTLAGQLADASLIDLDLGASTLTIVSLLNEAGGERVAGANLPVMLTARPGSHADSATFKTPGGARPKVRVELSRRGDEVVSVRLVVEFAPGQKPEACAGTPRTTELTTTFQIDPGPVSVTTTQPWQCVADDSQLRLPVP